MYFFLSFFLSFFLQQILLLTMLGPGPDLAVSMDPMLLSVRQPKKITKSS
jgi:hypothetical protein